MSKISDVVVDIHRLDDLAERDIWINHIHPLAKVLVTLWYLILVMSFERHNIIGLCGMSLYLIAMIILGELSIWKPLYRLRFVFLAVGIMGIANPLLDRDVVLTINGVGISGGMITMLSLFLKTVMAILATLVLIETTSIDNICYALQCLRLPGMLITLVMLIYRYVILMLKQVERVQQAYSLRAPGQKGIHYRAWGSLVGLLLLRSMDRAELVYESMTLRGFRGSFYPKGNIDRGCRSGLYASIGFLLLLILRLVPVFTIVGALL